MDLRERRDLARDCVRHPWERARLEVVGSLLRRHGFDRADRPGDVVDVGAGDGFVPASLAARVPFRRFLAVDAAYDDVTLAALRAAAPPANLAHARALPEGARARFVLLLDVLEHVDDDVGLLAEVAGHLADGTARMLVTVPAFPWLFGAHDRFLGHVRRYRRVGLETACTRAGLVVDESGYFFLGPLLARVVARALERVRLRRARWRGGLGAWRGGERLAALVARVLLWDHRLARLLRRARIVLPGLSCYAICRKP